MPPANPLLEKFTKLQASNDSKPRSTSYRSVSPTRTKSPIRSSLRSPLRQLSLANKYEDFIKTRKPSLNTGFPSGARIRRQHGSPIKSLSNSLGSINRAKRLPRAVQEIDLPFQTKKWDGGGVWKTWSSRKEQASRKDGVFSRLRNFLEKFNIAKDGSRDTLEQLQRSAGLKDEDTPKKPLNAYDHGKPQKYVTITNDLYLRRTKPSLDDEIDEVDEAMRLRRARDKELSFQNSLNDLKVQLAKEREKIETLQNEHELEILKLRAEHRSTIQALNRQISELEFNSDTRTRELEQLKIADLKERILKDMEFLSKKQHLKEQELARRERGIQDRENSIRESERTLQARKLDLDQKSFELERRSLDLERRERQVELMEKQKELEPSHNIPSQTVDLDLFEASTPRKSKDVSTITSLIEQHDAAVQSFYDNVHKIAENIITKGNTSVEDKLFLDRLGEFVETLEHHMNEDSSLRSKWDPILSEYEQYFSQLAELTSKQSLQEKTDIDVLDRIEHHFVLLKESIENKIRKRQFHLDRVETSIKDNQISDTDYDPFRASRLCKALKKKSEYLQKQKSHYAILSEVEELSNVLAQVKATLNA